MCIIDGLKLKAFQLWTEFCVFDQATDQENCFESGGEKLGFIEKVSPAYKWCNGVENYAVLVSEHFSGEDSL